MPINVRVAYRRDLESSDLPQSNDNLSLSLTFVYVQSDGSGSDVTNSGVSILNVVSGDGTNVEDEICIDTECFYVISSTDEVITMLSKNNITLTDVPVQHSSMNPTVFSSDTKKGINYSDYNGSIVEQYVNNYYDYLTTLGIVPVEARLITSDELVKLGCSMEEYICPYESFITSTSYWTGSAYDFENIWYIDSDTIFEYREYSSNFSAGIRPVIVLSRSVL